MNLQKFGYFGPSQIVHANLDFIACAHEAIVGRASGKTNWIEDHRHRSVGGTAPWGIAI